MYICIECDNLEEELEIVCSYGERQRMDPDDYYGNPMICSRCGEDMVEAKLCDECGEWLDPERENRDWCKKCLEEHTNEENILNYINATLELQKEFYIYYQFDCWNCVAVDAPNELLDLCKKQFEEVLRLGMKFPQVQAHTNELLQDFVRGDIDHFYDELSSPWRGW